MGDIERYELRGCGINIVDHVFHNMTLKEPNLIARPSGVTYEEQEDLFDILYWVVEDFSINEKKLMERIYTYMEEVAYHEH